MSQIYSIVSEDDAPSVSARRYDEQNWWSLEVFPPGVFESLERQIHVQDEHGNELPASMIRDCCWVAPGVFAFGERAWSLLPLLQATGCRIAPLVTSGDGQAFKLVYPGAVVDILDHALSKFSVNEPRPGEATYSSIRPPVLYETQKQLPPLFRVLVRHPGIYRGVSKSPSVQVFATDEFHKKYCELQLTGIEFIPRERSRRSQAEPENIVVYSPAHA